MTNSGKILTPRLELVPATLEILWGEQEKSPAFGEFLDARIPQSWPPALFDPETLEEFIRMKSSGTDPNFMSWYWILNKSDTEERILIGSGGICSSPQSDDTVVIGYSVLPEFQNLGYATEAVDHLIPVIFRIPGIENIVATTHPDLMPSVRVLTKTGFVFSGMSAGGSGMEEGTARYLLKKT
jgi:[ribosomal protein S5]-alanine N-acetyltransferase